MLFSQRQGIKPVKVNIQIDSMDDDLRNRLWNALIIHYWSRVKSDLDSSPPAHIPETQRLIRDLWHEFFKEPLDTIPARWSGLYQAVRDRYFPSSWDQVYDLIEFFANNDPYGQYNSSKFMEFCNTVLEQEVSAYRFVGGKIVKITSKHEIAEIEAALETPTKPVSEHLKTALTLLTDRESPDYRNSVKESISAVESLCKLIANDPNATLGKALDEIKKQNKVKIHPALESAFDNLYGYTSSADGIRHALLDEPNLSFEDAKFMLVSCSAFVNYLISKASSAGISLC